MTIAMITPPALEPISLTEVKAHLRIDHDHEDTLLVDTLRAARQHTEFACGKKLITQTWRQYETCFPAERLLNCRVSPVQSISAVTVFDDQGVPQILAADASLLVRGAQPQVIEFANDITPTSAQNGLEIDLIVGLADHGVEVPDTLKRAILLLIAHWYEFRGAVSPQDQPVSLPPGFEALVRPFKSIGL